MTLTLTHISCCPWLKHCDICWYHILLLDFLSTFCLFNEEMQDPSPDPAQAGAMCTGLAFFYIFNEIDIVLHPYS
jgi:hypothetical protein